MPQKSGVLVVEDNEDFRIFLTTLLRRHLGEGVLIESAIDGAHALEVIERFPAHLIVTDTNMPRLNGIRLLEAVKGKDPNVKVVVLFEGLIGTDITHQQVVKMGADLVIRKGEILQELLPYLERLEKGNRIYNRMRAIFPCLRKG